MTALHTEADAGPASGRRRPRGWPRARRAGLWAVGGLVSAVALAMAGAALLDGRDQRRPPPGEVVELPDGRVLHLQIAGVEHDGPTVVLDAGQGLFSPSFAWLQSSLAEHATRGLLRPAGIRVEHTS